MSERLHCDINDLVDKRLEQEGADLTDLARRVTESLVDLILLGPRGPTVKIAGRHSLESGPTFLEKSGAIEADETSRRH